jgi:hypothetical protein
MILPLYLPADTTGHRCGVTFLYPLPHSHDAGMIRFPRETLRVCLFNFSNRNHMEMPAYRPKRLLNVPEPLDFAPLIHAEASLLTKLAGNP